MHWGLSWHPVPLIHARKLRILKSLHLCTGQSLPVQECESLSELSQSVILIKDLLIGRGLHYLLAVVDLVAEGRFFQVMLDSQLVEDVIEVLVQDLGCLLVQRSI